MENYLLLFRSLTSAQRAEKILRRIGIPSVIARVPGEIPTNGCSYCLKLEKRWLTDARKALKSADLSPTKIYAWFADGSFSEV